MEQKPKVLIVHNYYQIPGGEDTVVANEKKLLEDHGHQVVLYTRHNSELKQLSAFQKLMLPFTTVFNPKTYREVKNIIREENIDVVHVHNTLNLISPSVYYAAFSCKVPVVQTVHNFRLLCPGATFYRDGHICEDCVKHGLWCAVRYKCYRGSRLQTLACVISTWIHRGIGTYKKLNYICLTEFNKKKLLNLKRIIPQRVFVKPNFTQAVDGLPEPPMTKDHFCYVGRLEDIKGTKLLFRAWEKLGDDAPRLVICGKGPLEDWCRQFLKEHPECPIQMRGFVPNSEAKQLMAGARAFVLPSQCFESFPVTTLESYSLSTPVIAGHLGNMDFIVDDGKTGMLFDYNSTDSLADTIRTFLQTDTSHWGENAHMKFQCEFNEERNYEILSGIYKKVMLHRIDDVLG